MRARRVVICGGCRTGKSTLAARWSKDHGVPVRASDDLASLGWSQASEAAALWLERPGPWICEGVAMARALRKWLRSHPDGLPCDVVVRLARVRVPSLLPGQASMNAGEHKVWSEVEPELRRRGVEIKEM